MTHEQLRALLDSLSLDEKVGQLSQIDMASYLSDAASATGPVAEYQLTREKLMQMGSIICGGNADAEAFARLQQDICDGTPHHIPAVIMSDVIHGMRTIFPIPLALGCTFDPESAYLTAEISAREAAACGIHATFAPMVDIVRDPRWGRCMECAGESVKLNSDMARAMVRGFRGDSPAGEDRLACCVKHFAAYGAVEAGLDYAPVDVSHIELYNTYFPPFKAALEEGCDMIMPAFTPIDRVPAIANHWLLKDVLRRQWGFDGMVISDWNAAAELIVHGLCEDRKEAALTAFKAGMDMDMMGFTYAAALKELVEEGQISEAELNEAVLRVLELKNKLGLFEKPCKQADRAVQEQLCTCQEHRLLAREAALKSCVLLKNEGVLPLNAQRVALCGSHADNHELIGAWAAGGRSEETPTLTEAFEKDGRFVLCCPEEADVILYAAGENQNETGEAGSKVAPALRPEQVEELKQLAALGKKIVLVLFCGRPLVITEVLPLCDAVMVAWFPGSEGAEAIRMLLTGEANPSGHLSMTFPRSIGQIPVHHDVLTSGRPALDPNNNSYVNQYRDDIKQPLFPFGHGLSYTTFDYSGVTADREQIGAGESVTLCCTVKNTGDRPGVAVPQLYLHCRKSSRLHALRELKGYTRVSLAPGEAKTVAFTISDEDLTAYDALGCPQVFASLYDVAIGESSAAPFTTVFRYV